MSRVFCISFKFFVIAHWCDGVIKSLILSLREASEEHGVKKGSKIPTSKRSMIFFEMQMLWQIGVLVFTGVTEILESMTGSKCRQKCTEHDVDRAVSQSDSLNLMTCPVLLAQEFGFLL
jgi:hypothetical protein